MTISVIKITIGLRFAASQLNKRSFMRGNRDHYMDSFGGLWVVTFDHGGRLALGQISTTWPRPHHANIAL